MPVRIGFPTGVKGITQLVQGPQYATAVGLVKYGAQMMAEANAREAAPPLLSMTRIQTSSRGGEVAREVAAPADKSKFWDWLKAAF